MIFKGRGGMKVSNNPRKKIAPDRQAKKADKKQTSRIQVPLDVERIHHKLIEKELKVKEYEQEIHTLREIQRRHEKALVQSEKDLSSGSRLANLQSEVRSLQFTNKTVTLKFQNSEKHISRLQDDLFKLHQENLRLSVQIKRQYQTRRQSSTSFDEKSISPASKSSSSNHDSEREIIHRKEKQILELQDKIKELEEKILILQKQRDSALDDHKTSTGIWQRKEDSWKGKETKLNDTIDEMKQVISALEYQRGRTKSIKMYETSKSPVKSRNSSRKSQVNGRDGSKKIIQEQPEISEKVQEKKEEKIEIKPKDEIKIESATLVAEPQPKQEQPAAAKFTIPKSPFFKKAKTPEIPVTNTKEPAVVVPPNTNSQDPTSRKLFPWEKAAEENQGKKKEIQEAKVPQALDSKLQQPVAQTASGVLSKPSWLSK